MTDTGPAVTSTRGVDPVPLTPRGVGSATPRSTPEKSRPLAESKSATNYATNVAVQRLGVSVPTGTDSACQPHPGDDSKSTPSATRPVGTPPASAIPAETRVADATSLWLSTPVAITIETMYHLPSDRRRLLQAKFSAAPLLDALAAAPSTICARVSPYASTGEWTVKLDGALARSRSPVLASAHWFQTSTRTLSLPTCRIDALSIVGGISLGRSPTRPFPFFQALPKHSMFPAERTGRRGC